jgi:23S rRNA pseudouridine1911/1915/1917 synthase
VLPVLAGDGDFVVVDKPAGLPVEPGARGAPSAVGAASLLGAFDVDGAALPGLPHRIDRDTTGCLLLARNDRSLAALLRGFQEGKVEKEYLSLVAGEPPDEGRLDTPYARDPADPRRFTTRVPSARRARLSFRVERRLAGAALLRVRLETGRTHQIRVQLAEAGWPILGDAVYGRPSTAIGRQALHAWRIAFPRPSDGARVEAEAPVPDDLAGALRAMEPRGR